MSTVESDVQIPERARLKASNQHESLKVHRKLRQISTACSRCNLNHQQTATSDFCTVHLQQSSGSHPVRGLKLLKLTSESSHFTTRSPGVRKQSAICSVGSSRLNGQFSTCRSSRHAVTDIRHQRHTHTHTHTNTKVADATVQNTLDSHPTASQQSGMRRS